MDRIKYVLYIKIRKLMDIIINLPNPNLYQ